MAGNNTQNANNNKDRALTIFDTGDNTKEVAFNVEYVTTGTTRIWTVDDRNINFDAVPTSIVTDSGTCTPSSGSFSIEGSGVSTSASGSTITVTNTGAPPTMEVGFLAYLPSTVSDVTGDNTAFKLGNTTALTEIYDVGSDFSTSGTFTAPNTGKFRFDISVKIDDMTSSHTSMSPYLSTSNGDYRYHDMNPYAVMNSSGAYTYSATITVDMDSSDTAAVYVRVANGTKVIDVLGDGEPYLTWFSGNQIG